LLFPLNFYLHPEAAKVPASHPATLGGQRYQSVYGNRRVHHFSRALLSIDSKTGPPTDTAASASVRALTFCATHNMKIASHNDVPDIPHLKRDTHMTQTFEDAGKYGKEFIDTGLKSFASLSKGFQAIAVEATEYSKKSFEAGSSALEKLVAAKSLEKAIEIQTDYVKQAYEGFIAEASKIGELYADVAKDAYKPFESIVAKAK
jgi:hypothetical protein